MSYSTKSQSVVIGALVTLLAAFGAAPAQASESRLGALAAAAPATMKSQGVGVQSAPRANMTQYADAVGDSGYANDISTVSIANDDAGGLTFVISVTNYPYYGPGDTLGMFLDTDANPATGSLGADFGVLVDGDTNTIGLARWAGTWDFTTPQSSLSGSSYYGSTIRLNRSELGATSGFNFDIVSRYADAYGADVDLAPEVGTWAYSVVITPPPAPPAPPAPAPAPAPVGGTAVAGAVSAPDTTLTLAAAKAKAQRAIKEQLGGSPTYGGMSCRKRSRVVVRCGVRFQRKNIAYRGTATVENYLDGNSVESEFTFFGTRTNLKCMSRATSARARKKCRAGVAW